MKLHISNQLKLASFIYLGQIICGYVGGWITPIIPRLQDPEQTILPDVITDTEASLLGSILFLGVLFGAFFGGFVAHKLGRKPCLIISSVIVFVLQLLTVTSVNITMMIAARVITGVGTGAIFNVMLVYLTEISSTDIRGILLTGTGLSMALGGLLVLCIGPYLPITSTVYISMALSVVYGVGLFFIPESPVFKMLQGKEEEAKQILGLLGRFSDDKDIMALKDKEKEEKKSNYLDIIRIKSNRKALFILTAMSIFQSTSGAAAMSAFTTSIFLLANMDIDPNVATIIVGVTMLISSCFSPLLVEKTGRRVLQIASCALCFICQSLMGVYFFLESRDSPVTESIRWLPLVLMIGFFVSYTFGLGIIPAVLTGELFTSEILTFGAAVTLAINWIFVFVSSVTYGSMIAALGGYGTFWVFAGFCLVALIVSIIFVPETRGKSLLEIQAIMNK